MGDTSHRTRNESVPSSVLSRLFPQTAHSNSAQSDWETAFSDSDQFRSATKRRNGPEADFKPRFSAPAIKFVDYIPSLGARCITLVWTMSSHSCASKGTGTSIQSRAFKPRVCRAGSTSRLRYRRRLLGEVRKNIEVTGPADSIDKQTRSFIA